MGLNKKFTIVVLNILTAMDCCVNKAIADRFFVQVSKYGAKNMKIVDV